MAWFPPPKTFAQCTCGHSSRDHYSAASHWCNKCHPYCCAGECVMYCYYGCDDFDLHCPPGNPGEVDNCSMFILDPSELGAMIDELRDIANHEGS